MGATYPPNKPMEKVTVTAEPRPSPAATTGSAELLALADRLDASLLGHAVRADVQMASDIIRRLAAKPAEDVREALNALSIWCSEARHAIGAVDGYDYRSGEEFGIRCVEIEIDRRAKALSTTGEPKR